MTAPEFRGFDVVRRGYDRDQVDRYLSSLSRAGSAPAPPMFDIARRGYDRRQVGAHVAGLLPDGETGA